MDNVFKIKLNSVNNAALFVKKCGSFEEDIDYIHGRYVIDAKSIMGIMSTDLGESVKVEIHTMHKIAAKEFTLEDFSCEHLETISRLDEDGEEYKPYMLMKEMIKCLNACRKTFMETKNKTDWWQLIQLLPSSYNQKRTVMLNYEVLANMYHQRKKHKLDEWRTFCEWIKTLPCSELITGEENE